MLEQLTNISENIGVIVIGTLITVLEIILINVLVLQVSLVKEKNIRNYYRKASIAGTVVAYMVIFALKLLFTYLNFLLTQGLFFAIGISVFFGSVTLLVKQWIARTSEHNKSNPERELQIEFFSAFKKKVNGVYAIAWLIGILALVIESLAIPITDPVRYSYVWTIITLLIAVGITVLINGLLPSKIRLESSLLIPSIEMAGVRSFAIWAGQLTLFGIFGRYFGVNLLFSIVSYLILYGIYGIFLFFALRKSIQRKKMQQKESTTSVAPTNDFREGNSMSKLPDISVQEKNESSNPEIFLEVNDLVTYFFTEEGIVRAVEGVSFKIFKNETLGLVGETGCGKSVTALSILQLVRTPGKIMKGEVLFEGVDLLKKSEKEILKYRGNNITMIFQDPLNSLNPVFKVGSQISEVFLLHQEKEMLKLQYETAAKIDALKTELNQIQESLKASGAVNSTATPHTQESKEIVPQSVPRSHNHLEDLKLKHTQLTTQIEELKPYASIYSIAKRWGIELLEKVGIPDPEQVFDRYPHELSGGMRQRVMIAMGLACCPKLLLADEPTTALDVTIQAQILELLKDLKTQYQTSILLITHDLGIIAEMCDRVAVMYSGAIVEYGALKQLRKNPLHPYTKGLIASIPRIGKKEKELAIISGSVPNLIYPPTGCRFHPRCADCFEPCSTHIPNQIEISPNYFVACHLYDPHYNQNQPEEI